MEQRFLARSGTDTRTFQNAESAVNYGVELEVTREPRVPRPTVPAAGPSSGT
jgi:hypothetical protein